MPTLTDLPPELRHEIFTHSIPSSTEPPSTPSTSQNRVRLQAHSDVWVPANASDLALPLLLTCRTFHADVRALQARRRGTYELDVMLVRRCGLWPTWISLPEPRRRHIGTLRVQFRIFDAPDDDFRRRFEQLTPYGVQEPTGVGLLAPRLGNWSFYHILNAILARGPLGLRPIWGDDALHVLQPCTFTIGTLVIDVLTPPTPLELIRNNPAHRAAVAAGTLPRNFWPPDRVTAWDLTFPYTRLERYVFPGPQSPAELRAWAGPTSLAELNLLVHYEDKLALFLANALWALLVFQLCVVFREGADLNGLLLYEGIFDHIEIRVDGVLRRRYDMEKLLDGIECPDKLAWKEWAREWRRARREGEPGQGPRVEVQSMGYVWGAPGLWNVSQRTLIGTRYHATDTHQRE